MRHDRQPELYPNLAAERERVRRKCRVCGSPIYKNKESKAVWGKRTLCSLDCRSAAMRKKAEDRFHNSYAVDQRGCWVWATKSKAVSGYGLINIKNTNVRAHRFSWTIHRGPIPNGLHVLHKCDVPACVNPAHLFLGTDLDNNTDKINKGRWRPRGPTRNRSKTTGSPS